MLRPAQTTARSCCHVRLAAATSVFAGLVLFLLLRTNSAGEQKSPGKVTLSAQLESSVGSAHSVGSAQLESSVGSAHSVGSAQLSLARLSSQQGSTCLTTNLTRKDVVGCCTRHTEAHSAIRLSACSVKNYAPPEESLRMCPLLPSWAVERAVTLRQASSELGRRLRAATVARPLVVVAIGGSVSAGPGGRSWLEHMKDDYFREAWGTGQTGAIQFYKLATNAMGPSYMARCLPRHTGAFGGRMPDVVIAEYAVNDGDAMRNHEPVDMRHLASLLADLGISLILLHHFAPAFLVGGSTYKGLRHTGEPVHERLASGGAHLTSASLQKATGLPSAWAPPSEPALSTCAFACAFTSDNIHPNPCGQRFLAQVSCQTSLGVPLPLVITN